MKNILIPLAAFAAVLTGCGGGAANSDNGTLPVIDVETAFGQPQELTLADLGESRTYVPLETTDESLMELSSTSNLAVTEDYIYVVDAKRPILCFDRKTGKYLRNIGGVGQGPNEYSNGTNFYVDAATGQVHVWLGGNRYQCYDRDGKWIETKQYSPSMNAPLTTGLVMDGKRYEYVSVPSYATTSSILCYDIHSGLAVDSLPLRVEDSRVGKQTKFKFPFLGTEIFGGRMHFFAYTDDTYTVGQGVNGNLWSMDGEIYLKEMHNDTIFRVKDLHHMEPAAVFHMGSLGERKRFDTADNLRGKYIMPRLLDTEERTYFTLYTGFLEMMESVLARKRPTSGSKSGCGIYNKRTGELKVQNSSIVLKHPVEGMPHSSVFTLSTTGEWVMVYQAEELAEARESIPEAKQPEWLKQLKEDDNPVILLVK